MKRYAVVAGVTLAALWAGAPAGRAQEPPRAADAPRAGVGDYVSREEYDKLRREQEEMRRELQELKREREADRARAPAPRPGQPPGQPPAPPATAGPTNEDFDELEKVVNDLKRRYDSAKPGNSAFTLHGDASVNFAVLQHSHSTFGAAFSPLILYKPTDRLLFEAALDIGVSTDDQGQSGTSVDLTLANANYIVNDYLTVGGGLFVSPVGVYHRHFDPPWINKLPDDPLVFGDSPLAPGSQLGLYANGAVPLAFTLGRRWDTRLVYDLFVSNGPALQTGKDSAGSLAFDNFTDINNNKAVGGRVGFLPVPQLEVGYSLEYGKANPTGFPSTRVLIQAVDANYVQDIPQILGVLTARAEWVWSNVGKATYDAGASAGFGPLRFRNARNGGYAMLAYRPTRVGNPFVRNLEFVARYDSLTVPLAAPGGEHERRFTFGVDYWLTPSWVLKAAYEIDHRKASAGQDAFLMQLGIGF